MAWKSMIDASDLPEGGMRLIPHGKREIGIFRHHGQLHAVLNFCPHAGAPICQGLIDHPATSPAPREVPGRDLSRPVLRCPWHHWEFDLQTGAAVCPISEKIKVYPVREENGRIWLDL